MMEKIIMNQMSICFIWIFAIMQKCGYNSINVDNNGILIIWTWDIEPLTSLPLAANKGRTRIFTDKHG